MLNRHHIVEVTLVVLLAAAGTAAFITLRPDGPAAKIEVFRQPPTFCGVVAQQSFSAGVGGVIASGPTLRPQVAIVRAGFIQRAAELSDTPEAMAPRLIALADNVKEGTDASLAQAKADAVPLDAEAHRRC